MRVVLAWRILTHDKGRTALAIAGVFMAILLVFVELGFFFAVPQGGMLLYDNIRFDLLMCSTQYEYQAQPGQFPLSQLDRVRAAPGVAEATALYFGAAKWRSGEDGKSPDLFVIGFDPRATLFEVDDINRQREVLERTDTVLIDTGTRAMFGPLTSGRMVTIGDHRVTIGGPAGTAACGKAVQLVNPNGNAPFPGNQIPVSLLSTVALGVMKNLPVSSAGPCGQVTFGIPATGDSDEFIGRGDYVVNSKDTLYGRYYVNDWSNPPFFNGNLLTTTQPGNFERAQEATIGNTYTFGPGTVDSFHLGFNRVRDNRGPTATAINWTMLGSQMYSAVPNFLLVSSMTGGFTTYCGTCAPGHFNVTSYQVADDLDLVRARHQISLGFNMISVQNNTISGFDENGAPAWNGQFTGLGMADFLLGRMSDFQQTNATPDDLRQWVMSFYAQDSFKVSPNFTLNFGVRWEPLFADPDKYGRGTSFNMAAFLANQVSGLHPTAPPGLFFPGDKGIPAANWAGHLPNFGPRVGVVWDPTGEGRQTLRAGAAILYDSPETWFNERETTNPPYGNDIDVGSTGTLTNPWAGYPGGNPFPPVDCHARLTAMWPEMNGPSIRSSRTGCLRSQIARRLPR